MPEIEAEHVLRNRILIAAGVVGAAIILSLLAKTAYMLFSGAKNTPIVVSGGSITGNTRHKRDWSLPRGADGTCPTNASSGQQTCLAVAKTPVAVVTSANLTDGTKYLYQKLDDPNWVVEVSGSNDTDPSDNPSLTIAPAQGCNSEPGEACVSFSIGNSPLAYFGPRHKKIEGIFGVFNPHHGRSIYRDGTYSHYHLNSVTVTVAGKVTSATCRRPDSCLVCLTDNATDTSACELK